MELNDKDPTITGDKTVTHVAAVQDNDFVEVDAVHGGRSRGRGRGRSRGRGTSRGGRGGQSGSANARFDGTCHYCKKPGHRIAECRKRLNQQPKAHATEVENQFYDSLQNEDYAVGPNYQYQEEDQAAEVNNVTAFDYLN